MLNKYPGKDFNEKEFLKGIMRERGITRKEAEKFCRAKIPDEGYFQGKVISGLKERFPGAFVRKIHLTAYSQAGFPDVLCIIDGHFFGFEVKRPIVGRATPIQKKTIEDIQKAGGSAGVVRWPEEAIDMIEEHKFEQNMLEGII